MDRVRKYEIQNPKQNEETSLMNEEKIPLSVLERRQTVQVYELFKEKAQWGEFYRIYGIAIFMLGAFFLVVPFYNVVCQTFGFSMRQHAKEYVFKDDQINVFRKYRVSFMAHTMDDLPWEFQPQTTALVVNAGETSLAFYKVYNRSDKPIAGIAVYQIFPDETAIYFNKIQCFCFENQLLYPKESVDLPILFYLDPAINHDPNLADKKDILLTYHFFPSADQSIAEVLQKEIEKHEEAQRILREKKELLKQQGIVLEEVKNPSVFAQGYNPKETPEMFVQKILKNQKRINKTIEMYEQNQLKSNNMDQSNENLDQQQIKQAIE